jgi:hypothetical protein
MDDFDSKFSFFGRQNDHDIAFLKKNLSFSAAGSFCYWDIFYIFRKRAILSRRALQVPEQSF